MTLTGETRCQLCGHRIPLPCMLEHLQVVHQLGYAVDTWPDGAPVVIDETLEPDDFRR